MMQSEQLSQLARQVIAWREDIHRHPELSHVEYTTSDYLFNQLASFGRLEVSRPATTGVVARLKGAQPGPIIAFRADIDALPVQEKLVSDHCSTQPGVMHACGHDVHSAMLLGAARALSEQWQSIRGEIVFIFQRGEEMSPGGAKELVDLGVLNGVEMFFALHVLPALPSGVIALKRGVATANRDTFHIEIHGQGGHSSMPHLSVDPGVAAAEAVLALQTIVSREIDPQESAVISVCSIISGDGTTAAIPNDAHICGTNRTFTPQVRAQIKQAMTRIVSGVAQAHRCQGEVRFDDWDYSAIVNDEKLCDIARRVVQTSLGEGCYREESRPMSVGEDFSEYQALAPVCFAWLGVGREGQDNPPLHNSYFNPDEQAFIQGVKYYLGLARELVM